jgi:hypothetical protein
LEAEKRMNGNRNQKKTEHARTVAKRKKKDKPRTPNKKIRAESKGIAWNGERIGLFFFKKKLFFSFHFTRQTRFRNFLHFQHRLFVCLFRENVGDGVGWGGRARQPNCKKKERSTCMIGSDALVIELLDDAILCRLNPHIFVRIVQRILYGICSFVIRQYRFDRYGARHLALAAVQNDPQPSERFLLSVYVSDPVEDLIFRLQHAAACASCR